MGGVFGAVPEAYKIRRELTFSDTWDPHDHIMSMEDIIKHPCIGLDQPSGNNF